MPEIARDETSMAARVRSARTEAGLTQQTLASNAGLALRTLARIEKGEDVKVATLSRVADALGVPVADLMPESETV